MPEIEVAELPELDRSIMPDYQKWKAEEQSVRTQGLWDYLFDEANHEIAAAFSKLFWPEFIEVEGLILLAERYPKLGMTPKEFKKKLKTNPGSIEYTVNHIDISYMYHDFGMKARANAKLYDYLARVLIFSWKHALSVAFPEKEFLCLYEDEPSTGNYRISFIQRKWIEGETNENSAKG